MANKKIDLLLNNNGRELSGWNSDINDFYGALSKEEYFDQMIEYLEDKRELDRFLIRAMVFYDLSRYDNFIDILEIKFNVKLISINERKSVDVTNLNVSHINDFTKTFSYIDDFNQDISKWDMSSAKDISYMFTGCDTFNRNINNWNISNVVYMSSLFHSANSFNQPLDKWDVSKVEDMEYLFYYSIKFNQYINNWDTSNVRDMSNMFIGAHAFKQNISNFSKHKDDLDFINEYDDIPFDEHNALYKCTREGLMFYIDKYKTSLENNTFDLEKNKYDLMKYMKQYVQHNNEEFINIINELKNQNIDITESLVGLNVK
jgi:surface protein